MAAIRSVHTRLLQVVESALHKAFFNIHYHIYCRQLRCQVSLAPTIAETEVVGEESYLNSEVSGLALGSHGFCHCLLQFIIILGSLAVIAHTRERSIRG